MTRINPKIVLFISILVMTTSLFLASMCTTFWTFFFFYAITYPIGGGIGYWVPILCAWEWFPNKRATASGVTLFAFAAGPFIFGFITTAIVNPDNL